MKNASVSKCLWTLLFLLFSGFAANASAPAHVVISQVYGGGGNSGAPYRYDFIELYNPTASAVDLSTWSVQYASSAGPSGASTTYFVANLSGTIAAGKHFLIRACIGSNTSTTGVDLPTPDYSLPDYTDTSKCALLISATSGKIALVSNQTALAIPFGTTSGLTGATCPTVNAAAIVDYVGFGTSATCYEGSAATATLSNTTAAIRDANNDDTNNNGADFTAASPNPRNSSYATATLAIASASGVATTPGNTSLLSVTVTPGSTSTGIVVTANLTQIGGSATQSFTLSATPNVYTYTATVGGSVAPATYQLPVSVTDQQSGSASGNIALTVQAPVVAIPIAAIQGNRSTYVGTAISTTGVVTLVTKTGFYIQTPSSTPGSTGVPEGILIFSGSGKVPVTAVVGNNVTVTGNLTLFPAATASHTPSLEIGFAAVTVNSTNQPLPTPVTLPTPTANGGIYQLTKYESMRVMVPSMTTTSGTDGFLTENTETVTSNGQFYAVLGTTARPFREPGMDFRDFPATTCPTVTNCTATTTSAGVARPSNLTLYDDNPERLVVESSLGSLNNSSSGTPVDVSTGAVITNITGVLDFSYATDVPFGDPARFIMDPGTVTGSNYTPGMTIKALAVPGANQFTVAAFNIERFFNTSSSDNLFYDPVAKTTKTSQAVNVTSDAYARRLKKVSLAVRTILNSPDIISFEENENVAVLKDIAAQIDTDAIGQGVTAPGYVAYGTDSTTTFTDDIGGISIGFLVKPATVNVVSFEQKGGDSTYQNASNNAATLNDRPSDVLHAGIKRGSGLKDYPVTVISNHLRSLTDVNDDVNVRTKKELQAEMLANLIQGYQQNKEHVVAVGDMNVFQFSDGYTDVMGTITGNVGTNIAAQPGKAIVTPAAVDLVNTLPAAQQQSYVEWGNAQVLDHVVVTADIASSTTLVYAHIDSDFSNILYNDPTTAAHTSDHDPALAYLTIPAPVVSGTLTGTGTFPTQAIGTTSTGQQFTLTNTGEAAISITSIAVTGDFAQTNNCGTSLAINASCAINVVFKPTAAGSRSGTLTVTSNASGITAANLSGTAPDFTFSSGAGSGSTSVVVTAGTFVTTTITVNSTNGFSGQIAFTCAVSGTAPSGATCSVTSPVTVAAGGSGTATVTINTTSRLSTSGLSGLPKSAGGRIAWMGLLLLLGMALSRVRRGRHSLIRLALLLVGLAIGVSGCGGSSSSQSGTNPAGTPAGTYIYNVTATSGSTSHTQVITATVL